MIYRRGALFDTCGLPKLSVLLKRIIHMRTRKAILNVSPNDHVLAFSTITMLSQIPRTTPLNNMEGQAQVPNAQDCSRVG